MKPSYYSYFFRLSNMLFSCSEKNTLPSPQMAVAQLKFTEEESSHKHFTTDNYGG